MENNEKASASVTANRTQNTSGTGNNTIHMDRDGWVDAVLDYIFETCNIRLDELASRDRSVAEMLRRRILTETNDQILLNNQIRGKGNALQKLNKLTGAAIARVLIETGDVKRMITGTSGSMLVAKNYIERDGKSEWTGTYSIINEDDYSHILARAISNLSPDATTHDRNRTYEYLEAHAPVVYAHTSDRIVFCRNGVWDYETRTFTNYDDPSYDAKYGNKISLSKLHVYHPYGKGATLKPAADGSVDVPVLHNDDDGTDWTPENGFRDPFNMDTEVGRASNTVIWQALQFMLRRMNGDPKLYHFWIDMFGRGHNGKSTIWAMFRRLIDKKIEPGDDDLLSAEPTFIDCRIDELDRPYILGQNILYACAIASEESDSSVVYVQKCARAKNLARAQEETYREIYKKPFSHAFNGFLLQQSNKVPQFGEKTDSVVSHFCVVPFAISFSDSRPYIKSEYVVREEVAEWILYHATVEMPCLHAYDAESLKVLEPYKNEMLKNSMSSFQALDDILPGLKMNYMPTELLYDLYVRWCDRNGVPDKSVVSAKVFRDDLEQYGLNNDNNVEFSEKKAKISMYDLSRVHPALQQFRRSPHVYDTEFAMPFDPFNKKNPGVIEGALNKAKFMSGNVAKVWSKGGLKRTVLWQDMPADDEEVEIDEDAGKM